jgi:hypothetical protein
VAAAGQFRRGAASGHSTQADPPLRMRRDAAADQASCYDRKASRHRPEFGLPRADKQRGVLRVMPRVLNITAIGYRLAPLGIILFLSAGRKAGSLLTRYQRGPKRQRPVAIRRMIVSVD